MTLALGLLATSASASVDAGIAASPESDLRCTAWAAMMVGQNQKNQEAAAGLSLVLAYFIGRWEGATGKPFEEGLTADYINGHEAEITGAQQPCLSRMTGFGKRLSDWGASLQGK